MALAAVTIAASACSAKHEIAVTNPSDLDRTDEIVEVDAAPLKSMFGDKSFRILDVKGRDVPYQLTYDGKIIFPATVKSGATVSYTVERGTPSATDSLVYGRFVPERKDDMAWENDRSAYRAYGPALQKSGERAFGYDIWTKSIPSRVIDKRYYDDRVNKISFHVDHGSGMDVYAVGPTLGGGTAALLDDSGEIVYPYCYEEYEVLDNGPLRFTVRLKYGALTVDGDTTVVETRVISLDKGSYLNRTTVSYSGLSADRRVAPGIVVHRQNPEGYVLSKADGYMAYSDLTENADNGNGIIFVGVVSPDSELFEYKALDEPCGDAIGHILAPKAYRDGEAFTYWWGSGWSKAEMPDAASWNKYLKNYAHGLDAPLRATIK